MMETTRTVEIQKKKGVVREYAEALLTALLVAFVIRSFVIEAFKIPSGSMIPTLMIGDHIFVNKFVYGLRIPFTKKHIVTFGTPKRGDAVVFMYPLDESKDFIKRVVGLPGDHVLLRGDEILINGQRVSRQPLQVLSDREASPNFLKIIPDAVAAEMGLHGIPFFRDWEDFDYYVETLDATRHLVQFDVSPAFEESSLEVPPNHLFVMGDNRDNSSDSREWGFVPLENIKGKAMFVWLSIDYEKRNLRWNRFGKWIQ